MKLLRVAEEDAGGRPEINMTPLVDVALVLVIIFMATATLATPAGIKILSSGRSAAHAAEPVRVEIRPNAMRVAGRPVAEDGLAAAVAAALAVSGGDNAWVGVAKGVTHERAVRALEMCRRAGAVSVSLDSLEVKAP